jgi:hypothetical protein
MNTRGSGFFGGLFMFFIFIIIWFAWLGGYVASVGHQQVVDTGAVGLWALFLDNMNIVIFFVAVFAIMSYMYFGSGTQ